MSSEKRVTRSSSSIKTESETDINKSTPQSNKSVENSKKRGRKKGQKGKKVISHDITPSSKSPSQKGGRVLRSMSNGKKKSEKQNPKSEEREIGTKNSMEKLLSSKKRSRKPSKSTELNTLRNRVRNLVSRMNYEQILIDAYSTDGWKGQSLEKLRPEKELDRAKSQIIKCKLKIRETFKQLEVLLSEGKFDPSLFDSKGEIDCDDIFCAKCNSKNVTLNNDIILCDGICDRGFHQNCLDPPLLTKDIPPGEEGWLCPACDCKVDCVELLNDNQGIHLTLGDSFEKVFPEAAIISNGGLQSAQSDLLPSDDSEDDDFDPDKSTPNKNNPNEENQNEESEESESESNSDDSDLYTDSDEGEGKNKNISGNKKGKNVINNVEDLPSEDSEDEDFCEKESDDGSDDFSSDSDDFCREIAKKSRGKSEEIVHEELSEDEDWSEKKRKKRGKALEFSSNNSSKNNVNLSEKSNRRKSYGLDKNNMLKEYFETNQYPSHESKQIFAEELGLTFQQVNKWFETSRHNARSKTPTQDPQNSSGPKKRARKPKNSMNSTDKIAGKSNTPSSNSRDKTIVNNNNMSTSKCNNTSEPSTPISFAKSDKSLGSPSKSKEQKSPMEFMDSERKKAILRELRKKKMGR